MKKSNIYRTHLSAAGRLLAASFFGLLITLSLCLSSPAQMPEEVEVTTTTNAVERAGQETVPSKSTVRGRAVYDDTNRPVRRARVTLLGITPGGGTEQKGMTNNSGEFEIKNVPAGTYFVMVDAAGIMTPLSLVDVEEQIDEKAMLDEVRKHFDEVSVNGINNVTVKVRAKRGGAINGKVTYADGDPAINVRLNILRKKKDGSIARFMTNMNPASVLGIQTDDRGIYRLAGLAPGDYIISVSESVSHGDTRDAPDEFMGMNMLGLESLVVTYYEGATKATSATPVRVEAGQEQNEINITLVERATHTISGTVVARRDNRPVRSPRITLRSKDSHNLDLPFLEGPGTSGDEQGRFTFNEIPDGVYTLTVEPPYQVEEATATDGTEDVEEEQPTPAATPSAPQRKLTRKQQDVTVSGSDINDLTIMLSEGASVSGTVTVEGGRPMPENAYIFLQTPNGDPAEGAQQAVSPEGSFTFDGLAPGAFYPNVTSMPEGQFYIKTMTANGLDLMRDPLMLTEAANIHGVQVIISPDVATIAGRVLSTSNAPVVGAQILLVPADQTRWRARGFFLAGFSEANGSYSITGAPGEYLIILLPTGFSHQAMTEAWIRERAATAQRVTLQPAQRKQMDLTAPAQ